MAKRHLTATEIDRVAQRAHLGPERRAALATAKVPADAPAAKLVDALVNIERTATALASHLSAPRVTEVRRHGGQVRIDTDSR